MSISQKNPPANGLIINPATGTPFLEAKYEPCPNCGRGHDKRVPSASFGVDIHPVCICGYEFKDQKWERPIL